MQVAVLGGCGTFMVGMATLAAQLGCKVSAFDQAVYGRPKDQLANLDIGFCEDFISHSTHFDQVVIGNAFGRSHPWVEHVLNQRRDYLSGAAWLAEHVLKERHVLAVAGTHGKTTTTSMLTWILEVAGRDPGYLIGGWAHDFEHSARLGTGDAFVVEADEYDTAFWDKRPKFMHYRPNTLILNNLEFDHADIYDDVGAIEQQFKWLLRTVPANGVVIARFDDVHLDAVLKEVHSPVIRFGLSEQATFHIKPVADDFSQYTIWQGDVCHGTVCNDVVLGLHNALNGLAAFIAAYQQGVLVDQIIKALSSFKGVARRLEYKGEVGGALLFEDFAHHPTAMALVLETLAKRYPNRTVKVLLELGSYTMREGFHWKQLARVLNGIDCWVLRPTNLGGDLGPLAASLGDSMRVFNQVDRLVSDVSQTLAADDVVVSMSSRGFDGVHDKLLALEGVITGA